MARKCSTRPTVSPRRATGLNKRTDCISAGLFRNSEGQKKGTRKNQQKKRVWLRGFYLTAGPDVGRGGNTKNIYIHSYDTKGKSREAQLEPHFTEMYQKTIHRREPGRDTHLVTRKTEGRGVLGRVSISPSQ